MTCHHVAPDTPLILIEGAARDFARGFALVMSTPTLTLFSPRELRALVEGEHALDFEALRAGAAYEGGFAADHPTVRAFWRVALGLCCAVSRRRRGHQLPLEQLVLPVVVAHGAAAPILQRGSHE